MPLYEYACQACEHEFEVTKDVSGRQKRQYERMIERVCAICIVGPDPGRMQIVPPSFSEDLVGLQTSANKSII